MDIHATELLDVGYTVIPLSKIDVASERKNMMETIQTFPEFKPNIPTTYQYNTTQKGNSKTIPMQYVGGGFSALGNPASFHNPWARKVRQWCMAETIPLFQALLKAHFPRRKDREEYKLEQIVDRMMFRPAGQKPTAESWHRDETPNAKATDLIFGGWLNLDDQDQYFSCIPRSRQIFAGDHSQLGKGFFALPKSQHATYNDQKVRVVIPSGHILVFFENTIHEVVAKGARYDMYRLFTAWRLTKESSSLHTDNAQKARLSMQAVMPLKSNQMPVIYPKLWWVNNHTRLESWSKALFLPILLSHKTRKNEPFVSVPVQMLSLQELGLPLYKKYDKYEKSMYKPGKHWQLLKPGNRRLRIAYNL